MARAIWTGEDAIGKCIRIGADTAPCSTVIGVAEEMRVRSLTDAREYTYYIPAAQYDLPDVPADLRPGERGRGDLRRDRASAAAARDARAPPTRARCR